jgi:peptidoglycan/LPS O-acetylase OafA/YrhL
MQKPENYLIQIDALRGLAVIAVMLHHFSPSLLNLFPPNFINLGNSAVRFFFVLSGFLITRILLKTKENLVTGSLTEIFSATKIFYIRRALRIFPIFYMVLLIITYLNLEGARAGFWWHFTYLSNNYFSALGEFDGYTAHFWTLAVEEQFYLVWPWVVSCCPLKDLRLIIWLMPALSVIFRYLLISQSNEVPLSSAILTLSCLDSLALGSILAVYHHSDEHERLNKTLKLCLLIGLFMVMALGILFINKQSYSLINPFIPLATSLIFTYLIGRASQGFRGSPALKSFLEWKPLCDLGRISYGVYLYHPFVLYAVISLLPTIGLPDPTLMRELLTIVLSSIFSVGLAIVSWLLIEKPFVQLKRFFPST